MSSATRSGFAWALMMLPIIPILIRSVWAANTLEGGPVEPALRAALVEAFGVSGSRRAG
jgi:hypothetical protein